MGIDRLQVTEWTAERVVLTIDSSDFIEGSEFCGAKSRGYSNTMDED